MTTFEWTDDVEAVRRILTDPRVYGRMKNDSAPVREAFEIGKGSARYVLAQHHSRPVAVFLLVPLYPHASEVHFCFTPEVWGRTVPIARAFIAWVWRCTSLNMLWGPVPSYNRLALRLALAAGFEICDLRISAGTKEGISFVRIVTRIERP